MIIGLRVAIYSQEGCPRESQATSDRRTAIHTRTVIEENCKKNLVVYTLQYQKAIIKLFSRYHKQKDDVYGR